MKQMRLIDADALADVLFDKRKNYPQWVADVIGGMPDAVVRCKDCKYRGDIVCPMLEINEDGEPIDYATDNWFCADGIQKEVK